MPVRDAAWPQGAPCWIDMASPDAAAARAFYEGLFGWQIEVGGPQTSSSYGMCRLGGRSVAGIASQPSVAQPAWLTYLSSDDVHKTAALVAEAGGRLLVEPMTVFGLGRMLVAQDPSGGVFGVWEAVSHIGVGVYNEPGTLIWNELHTRGHQAAKDFYSTVFDFRYAELAPDMAYWTIQGQDERTLAGIGALPDDASSATPPGWLTYFGVADTDAAVAKALELGAVVTSEPRDSPFGRIAVLRGPQQEMFAVISVPETVA